MKKIKYFREKIIISVLIFIFIILTGARKYVSSYYNEDKGYEWSAYARTTTGLPVMFAKCSLHHTGYYENNCEKNIMLYGDGSDRRISCGGSGFKVRNELYPDSLKILYYSFNENKFYGGAFKLDYTKIVATAEKMRNAVEIEQEGTQSIDFEAKIYPLGKIVVSMKSYLKTSIGEVVIANLQAIPENHDWSVFANDRSDKRGISKNTSIAIQRALLLTQYNWHVDVVLPKNCSIENLNVDVYGNKSLKMDTIKNTKVPTYGNFVYLPQKLSLRWQRKDTIQFNTGFYFDEQEIIKAFNAINNKDDILPITMRLIVKDDTTAVRAILYGNDKSIELKKIDASIIYKNKIY